jgi:predicted type IV restriction endonuclease
LPKQTQQKTEEVSFGCVLLRRSGFTYNELPYIVALMALKRKKAYEANIEKINGARMTIETQMMAIENANVNLETMGAMRAGAEAMKNIHGSM